MRALRPLRVVLYDEHLMCLEGLTAALDEPAVAVVGMTTDRDEVPDLAVQLRPDVCIIDVPVPDADCLSAIADITSRAPHIKIVALVDDLPVGFFHEAVAAGVHGFARKDSTLRALHHTIDRVAAGLAPVGAQTLLRARSEPVASRSMSAHQSRLTEREHEVLGLLIAGEDTRHIAAELDISRSTARTHVQNVRHKLGAHTRLQAVAFAVGGPGHPSRLDGRSIAQ